METKNDWMKMQLNILPTGNDDCAIRAVSDGKDIALQTLGVRAFTNHYEITVVDLSGNVIHQIVIRQNGDIEVDS
jgi:secreted protein with Ig-like and vWFA domain